MARALRRLSGLCDSLKNEEDKTHIALLGALQLLGRRRLYQEQ
jgi:hypothetical protein